MDIMIVKACHQCSSLSLCVQRRVEQTCIVDQNTTPVYRAEERERLLQKKIWEHIAIMKFNKDRR